MRPGDSADAGKYSVTPQGLVIKNVTQSDRGAYKCKATQLDEEITDFQEMIIDLRVQRKSLSAHSLENTLNYVPSIFERVLILSASYRILSANCEKNLNFERKPKC